MMTMMTKMVMTMMMTMMTNADGDDDLAFVALAPIPAGTVLFFTDNEWNGSAIGAGGAFNTGESEFNWTSPTEGISAGTVVRLNNVDNSPTAISASQGTVAYSVSTNTGVSATDDTVYVFEGSSQTPTGFIAAITNAPVGALSEIGNTSLTYGSTAIMLPSSTDIAAYNGSRTGETVFSAYAPIINNPSNWITQLGTGDQNLDGTPPDVPFSTTSFTIGALPDATVAIAATASVSEGNTGSTPLNLAVTRTADTTAFSVDYAVTGGTATSGTDFTPLAAGTLTFTAGGALSQNITLDILGDTTIESNETIIVTLNTLVETNGTTALGNVTGTATITNDDSVPVTFPASGSLTSTVKGSIGLTGAEIPAFDPISKRAFAASGVGIQVVDLTNPSSPAFITTIQPSTLITGLTGNDISSVAIRKGTGGNPSLLAAAIINSPKNNNGYVVFLNAATGALLGSAEVGSVPDHIAFTPDGSKLLVCNEGELNGSAVVIANDTVPGTVSIINVTNIASPVVTNAGFASFNASAAALKAAGVRLFDGGIPEFDFEPEYLAISPDGTKAMVTLQEANAVALLDIATATFTSVVPLGEKNFSTGRHDFSDRDAAGAATGIFNPTTGNPVFGLYMPDAIASYQVGGQTYYITANEGDDRNDFLAPDETTTVSNSGYNLDDTVFPNEATLKTNPSLGRLVVSNATGLRGDTDNDGDIDRILSYGGRSFSILDSNGAQVFDSGDMIEMIVGSQFPAQLDDGRSDAKGPEPEGVTIAKIGARTFAFVGLERAHMVLAFDVTNPIAPTFAAGFQRTGDFNPEGMVVVEAADSPTGKPLLIVASESSNTLTTFEIGQPTDFKLQLLHLADAEAGLLASSTAPNLAALVDAFDGTYANTLILAGGDNFIPGPFVAGGTDLSVREELNAVTGSTMSALSSFNHPTAAVDIAIHNVIGVEASTIGNHEFDLGTRVFSDAIRPASAGGTAGWAGANFPYLSANLDFSLDSDISGRFTNTLSGNNTALIAEASTLKGRIAPSAVITKGGQKIGLVGATTQIVERISSTGNVEVNGFSGDGAEVDDIALLATQLQPAIDELRSEGVNKIILMAHLQQITFEQQLAPLLNGVDIILAAGSNTRLGDSNDVAAAFNGHSANFAGNYPIYTAGSDGQPTVIVNTDNEFTYLGRLVADFDSDGVLIVPNLTANIVENGAYAATDANVAAAWNTTVENLASTAFVAGTKGAQVKLLTDAVQAVINAKDGDVRGYTNVYLEGERNIIRNQETNLGNITADSMVAVTKAALPSATHIVGFKNGGGIRSSIGAVEVGSGLKTRPIANPSANKAAGAVSLLDIENSLRFNNGLMVCDTTPAGLKAIIEHGLASLGNQGRFPQVGGVRFSYNPGGTVGSRVQSIVLVDENNNITGRVVSGGTVRADAPAVITLITLNFLAQGGDSYPFKANADNFRYLLNDGTLSAPVDEASNFSTVAPSNLLGEQLALSIYLQGRYASPSTAFSIADAAAALDTRIQSTAVRTDSVLAGPATFSAWLAQNGFTSTGIDTDTDNDGVKDSLEYFFNQNPNNGADLGNLPKLVTNGSAKELQFAFNNQTTLSGDLQVSSDLTTWETGLQGVDYTVASAVVTGDETAVTYALPGTGASAPGTSATYLTPNSSDPVGASLGGVRVVNQGLVGVGRLSGNSLDKFGETQGAASGLFISDWTWNGSQFTGKFNVLPDRGFGDGTSNYAARLHDVNLTFSPYYGTTPVAQGQVQLTYADSTKFTYQDGAKVKFTTGLNPTGTSTLLGQTVGTVTAANGEGGAQESLLSMDAEAVFLFADGSGYISDEYGTYIARFDATKKITGLTQLPGAARPHRPAGTPNFDSATAPTNGRRNNQGLEGMSVTPDGTRLFALLQSATVQDTNGSQQQTRNNARLFVYDIVGANRENPVIIGEYVVKLPQIDLDPNTAPSALNGTAAQSEIVALGNSSFLMLPRDGNGLGKGTTVPITFKSVQLVDFASATNILGQYDAVGAAVSPGGVLAPGVKAAASAEIINMLEPTDLAKFGINTNTSAANSNTLNEKMEGMALVPDVSTTEPNDFFLFIANDNDFQSSDVQMVNAAGVLGSFGDGRNPAGGITNDAMFYAYRIIIDASGKKFYRFDVK
jgi:2',3'-cyclic-nucleotide 2'-phosphodiesterase (5'-nucleotidase family)